MHCIQSSLFMSDLQFYGSLILHLTCLWARQCYSSIASVHFLRCDIIEAADATKVKLESGSLELSESVELQLETNQDRRHDQQPGISETSKDGRLSIAAATPPTQTVFRSQRPSPVTPGVDLSSNRESNKFTQLSAALRAKLGRIADSAILATLWDYLNYKRIPFSSVDDCAGKNSPAMWHCQRSSPS